MNKKKVAAELVDIAKLVTAAKEETLGDALKGRSFKKKWMNFGDINYEDYGGDQVKYDGRGGFEIAHLYTPDGGYPGFILGSGMIDVIDIFDGRPKLTTPISELQPSSYAKKVASFVGAKWHDDNDAKDVGEYVINVVMGVSGYGGYMDDDVYWNFDDYDIEDFDSPEEGEEEENVERMKSDIHSTLKNWGLDI